MESKKTVEPRICHFRVPHSKLSLHVAVVGSEENLGPSNGNAGRALNLNACLKSI